MSTVTEPPFEAALISRTAATPAFVFAEATAPPPKTNTAEVPAASPARMNLYFLISVKAPSKEVPQSGPPATRTSPASAAFHWKTTHRG